MRQSFDANAFRIIPTISDLAELYDIPRLGDFVETKQKNLLLLELHGVSIVNLGIENLDCDVIFNYSTSTGNTDTPVHEGFELLVLDKSNQEEVMSVYYGASGKISNGHYDVTSGQIVEHKDTKDKSLSPEDVISALLTTEAEAIVDPANFIPPHTLIH